MADINRVVKGSPEQLTTILTNGSITVDDITVTREEIESGSTLFDTGRLDQMALNQQIKADMHRLYGYNHTAVVRENLETVYNGIIATNPALATKSAIGIMALLNDGDVIPIQENEYGVKNILFINGVREYGDYTFSGENSSDGTELVKIWYFENDGVLTANRATANVAEINIKVNQTLPNFSTDFFDYADNVVYNMNLGLNLNLTGVKIQKTSIAGTFSDNISSTVYEYENNCTNIVASSNSMTNKVALKKATFWNLEEIPQTTGSVGVIFSGCTNAEIILPNLKKINGSISQNACPFRSVKKIDVPSSVTLIGQNSFRDNSIINLYCINATSIHASWCINTPAELFSMGENWGATINIATAAAQWDIDKYKDLIKNKLKTMTSETVKTLTVAGTATTGIYNTLNTTLCTVEGYETLTWVEYAAQVKHWTIAHA